MRFETTMLKAYLVGGSQDTQGRPAQLLAKVEVALQNGITMFQYREKGPGALTGVARIQLGHRLRALCRQYDCPFVVDDDLALARELGADGIHVGQRDQGIEAVLTAAQAAGLFVGYSCATAAQVARANQLAGVAYVGSGPVFPTTSKVDADPALGVAGLATLVAQSYHPVVAIGGLNATNLATVWTTGVAGTAVISLVLGAHDVAKATRQFAKYAKIKS